MGEFICIELGSAGGVWVEIFLTVKLLYVESPHWASHGGAGGLTGIGDGTGV